MNLLYMICNIYTFLSTLCMAYYLNDAILLVKFIEFCRGRLTALSICRFISLISLGFASIIYSMQRFTSMRILKAMP